MPDPSTAVATNLMSELASPSSTSITESPTTYLPLAGTKREECLNEQAKLNDKIDESIEKLNNSQNPTQKAKLKAGYLFMDKDTYKFLNNLIDTAPNRITQLEKLRTAFNQHYTNALNGTERLDTVNAAAAAFYKAQDLILSLAEEVKASGTKVDSALVARFSNIDAEISSLKDIDNIKTPKQLEMFALAMANIEKKDTELQNTYRSRS